MSGHSKWHQIKRKKEATDAKRGQEFTKLATLIKQAAKDGTDPTTNNALADAISRAKRANMPQSNIDRLLAKATAPTQETVYEAFGPNGVALLIVTQTDNNRRTIAEVRTILKSHQGSMGIQGSALWKFKRGETGQYSANYPQTLPKEASMQLKKCIEELESINEVESVIADAANTE